jgi:hypothetical protein
MPDQPAIGYRLWAIYRRDRPPGPAAGWLLRQFVEGGAGRVNAVGLIEQ